MYEKVRIVAHKCTCDVCRYQWVTTRAEPPQFCQNRQCRSREWNGKKKPSYVNQIKLPTPRRGRRLSITLLDEDDQI